MHFKLVPRCKGDQIVWSGRHACHVRVTGKVQGVLFRAWTRDQARELGVGGWVQNCSDGSVEARLEGSHDGLIELLARLQQGPPQARVEQVQTTGAGLEQLTDFEVRH